jgi:hypothetical protein
VSEVDAPERRHGPDRRKNPLRALFYGSFNPRRRGSRRDGERSVAGVDWHDPQWLAVAMLIVLFSCVDAFLTLTLLDHGAYEVNPLMAPLVGGSALAFSIVKIGLTASGVVMLTLLARMKAFGRVPVSLLLYTVLVGYGALLVYEFRLLQEAMPG